MIDLTDWPELLPLMALAALAGCFAGFLSGLLGVGGGMVIVPVLYHLFGVLGFNLDVSLHMAIGTSLATIIITQLRSARGHYIRGSFDARAISLWGPPIVFGGIAGSVLAGILHGQALAFVFSFGMSGIAGLMFFQASSKKERHAEFFSLASLMRFPAAGFSGMMSVIMGTGGGTFNVTFLTMLFGMNIRTAIGTASGLGVLVGLVGFGGFLWTGWNISGRPPLSIGYVSLPGFLAIVPFTILFSPLGVRMAHVMKQNTLRILFAIFLVIAAVNLFYDAITYAG